MRRRHHWIMPPLPAVFICTVTMSLACLPGCQAEAEAPSDTDSQGTVTGQRASALAATSYDFIANAPGAFWTNNDGGVAWGTANSRGACLTDTAKMEDNVSHTYLLTQPRWITNGYMHGTYTVTIPSAALHPTFTATFGFKSGANSPDGVTFGLKTQIDGNWVTLFSQHKDKNGSLALATTDLSAYGGQTLKLVLTADAGSDYQLDMAAWSDARITADSVGPPSGGCTINNVAYANQAVNPLVSCQICDPVASTTSWSIRTDSCLIGGTCYAAEQQDSLKCRRCDPMTSTTSWSNQAQCDALIVASTNFVHDGDWAGLQAGHLYPDTRCAAEGDPLGLPGTWKAMISDPTVRHLKDTVLGIYADSKPVINLAGDQMYSSWNSIFTNQIWPSGISMYKFGTAAVPAGGVNTGTVWTGTNTAGQWDTSNIRGSNCSNSYNGTPWDDTFEWASLHSRTADYSQRKLLDGGWNESTGFDQTYCDREKSFQCVLVPKGPQATVQNYDGTAMGIVQGTTQRNAIAYLGIPYAGAPTAANRLAPPTKVTSWSGVRILPDLNNRPPGCPQPPFLPIAAVIGQEDCLFLNIWTPRTAVAGSNLPVIVYHHGGGLLFGSSTSTSEWVGVGLYDGDRLAAPQTPNDGAEAVVVTLQTRLAALGYLASPELSADPTSRTSATGGGTSGNYGLLDGIQALKWIKKNIAAFGGDPNRIMLAGQSGGASLVAMLIASPLAKDPVDNKSYFSSAWLMSGYYEEPAMSKAVGTSIGMPETKLTQTRYSQTAYNLATLGCAHRSGTPPLTLTFRGVLGGGTITRSTGSWITDGFKVDDIMVIRGSAYNNVTAPIHALSATVITLGTTPLVDEGPVSGVMVSPTRPALTFTNVGATGDTITRSTGSWITDGFAVGDLITVTGAATLSNNVEFVPVTAVTATVLTLGSTPLTTEGPVSNAQVVGVNPTTEVACLRSAPLQKYATATGDILYLFPKLFNNPTPPEVAFGLPFGPSVDRYVLPNQPRVTIAAGQHQKVPVVVGSTEKEGSTFMVLALAGATRALVTGDWSSMVYIATCSSYVDRTNTNLGAMLAASARGLPPYQCVDTLFLGPTTAYSNAITHAQYECPARRMARALVAGPSPATVRRYWFSHDADHFGVFQNLGGFVPQIGAAHALDVPYVFGTHNATLGYRPSDPELVLTKKMQAYWKAMAATGNPNPTGTAWTAYSRTSDNTLNLKTVGEDQNPADTTGPVMVNRPGASALTLNGNTTSLCDFWDDNFTLDGWK